MPDPVSGILIGSSVLGAGAKAISANNAAGAQQRAASNASTIEEEKLKNTEGDFAPYLATGAQANNMLASRLPELTAPVSMTQEDLEKTPGYQFARNQGLKAIQNTASSRGLGASGAAQKGAATFATGLADNTYQNQFQNAVTNQTNSYNRLLEASNAGETAANNLGVFRNKVGASQGENSLQSGNAAAAGYNAVGSDIGSGISDAAGGYLRAPAITANNALAISNANAQIAKNNGLYNR